MVDVNHRTHPYTSAPEASFKNKMARCFFAYLKDKGAFMNINASTQEIAGGFAASVNITGRVVEISS